MDAEDAARLALARGLGEQALTGFGLGLALLLFATGGLWWLLRRWQAPSERSSLPPAAFLLLRAALGFALIVGAAGLFAALADEVGAQDELGAFDEAFTAGLRSAVPDGALRLFAVVTHGADTAVLALLGALMTALLLWRGRRALAIGWLTALGGNALLNVTLKGVFQRVRPLHDDGLVLAHGWSFPSGHASGAVVAYGMLAYLAVRLLPPRWHLPAMLLAAGAAFAIGCSRVFLRVHHASDVAAGFASGLAWLAVCILSVEATRWYRRTWRAA